MAKHEMPVATIIKNKLNNWSNKQQKRLQNCNLFTWMSFTYALKLIQPKIAFKQPTTANTARNAKKYVALNGSLKSPSDIVITLINNTTKRGT